MYEQPESQLSLFAQLPALTADEVEDAEFRTKDRAWAALIELFEDRKEEDGLNFQILGDRIGRSRSQVQRWLRFSGNMTLGSIGLLAEGMDADLEIQLNKRCLHNSLKNHVHPSDHARWITANTPTLVMEIQSSNHMVAFPRMTAVTSE